MNSFEALLKGGDLRSIGKSNTVVSMVNGQQDFDVLFSLLFHADRKIVMRAADAIEKVTMQQPGYLQPHKTELLQLCKKSGNIELKWHLALLVSRLKLAEKETGEISRLLVNWAANKKESRIVRVNALQGLFELAQQHKNLQPELEHCMALIEKENIPSLNARLRKLGWK